MELSQETFAAVDAFVEKTLVPRDKVLQEALDAADAAGLPQIQVSPPQGRLFQLLARLQGARTVLEFGTLGGYSTILLAQALPEGGRLISLDANAEYAEVARGSIERAGVGELVELRVGPALETLPGLEDEGAGPFDLTFIDADKQNAPAYFSWALDHSRSGSLIVADNVVRAGGLADAGSNDPKVQAQRRLHEMLTDESRVAATTIQTVGSKGYDGFTVALVGDKAPGGEIPALAPLAGACVSVVMRRTGCVATGSTEATSLSSSSRRIREVRIRGETPCT